MNLNKKKLLKEYIQSVKELNKMIDGLKKAGIELSESMIDTIYAPTTFGAKAIEELINPNGFDWIEWFIWDNNFGENGLRAGNEEDFDQINNLDDLWRLINDE